MWRGFVTYSRKSTSQFRNRSAVLDCSCNRVTKNNQTEFQEYFEDFLDRAIPKPLPQSSLTAGVIPDPNNPLGLDPTLLTPQPTSDQPHSESNPTPIPGNGSGIIPPPSVAAATPKQKASAKAIIGNISRERFVATETPAVIQIQSSLSSAAEQKPLLPLQHQYIKYRKVSPLKSFPRKKVFLERKLPLRC